MAASGMTARQSSTTSWAAPAEQPVRKYRTQHISVVVLGGKTQAAWKRVGDNFARAKTVRVDDWRQVPEPTEPALPSPFPTGR